MFADSYEEIVAVSGFDKFNDDTLGVIINNTLYILEHSPPNG